MKILNSTTLNYILGFVIILSCCPLLFAETGSPANVTLDVVVTDKAGNRISGLQAEDFTLLVDNRPRPGATFQAADIVSNSNGQTQVIFLLDAVNTAPLAMSNGRQQLQKFLRQGGGALPVPMSLILFTDKSTQAQGNPTRDGNLLADTLDKVGGSLRDYGRSSGFFANVERVQRSLRVMENLASYEAKQPGRKLLICLSTGWPLMFGPESRMTSKDQETLFRTIVKLSTELREARVTVYDIDPLGIADASSFQTFYYQNYLKGVASAGKVESGDAALQVIATQTGGQVLNRSNNLTDLIADCVQDVRAYYTISFVPDQADQQDEYHDIRVNISKPGLTARTRTGYYALRVDKAK